MMDAEIQEYIPWVKFLARKVNKKYEKGFPTIDIDDMMQAGMMGLFKAKEKYKPDHLPYAKFKTYAEYWVNYFIQKEIYNNGFMCKLPKKLKHKDVEKFRKTCNNEIKHLVISTVETEWSEDDKEQLRKILPTLSKREQIIINYKFGIDSPLITSDEEIGKQLGLSHASIGRIFANAKTKLKRRMS